MILCPRCRSAQHEGECDRNKLRQIEFTKQTPPSQTILRKVGELEPLRQALTESLRHGFRLMGCTKDEVDCEMSQDDIHHRVSRTMATLYDFIASRPPYDEDILCQRDK
jgi:hypothetical protein